MLRFPVSAAAVRILVGHSHEDESLPAIGTERESASASFIHELASIRLYISSAISLAYHSPTFVPLVRETLHAGTDLTPPVSSAPKDTAPCVHFAPHASWAFWSAPFQFWHGPGKGAQRCV